MLLSSTSSPPGHVVITGASSGLGAALARVFARQGATLALTGREAVRLAQVAEECRVLGAGEVAAALIDVTDALAMERWLTERDDGQAVDLIIANAGFGGPQTIAHEIEALGPIARRAIEINTLGVVNTVVPLLPRLARRCAGHIAIVSSIAGLVALPDAPSYSAAKAAAAVFGDGLHRLLAVHGVRVSVIYPGFVDTPMGTGLPYRPLLWSTERAAQYIARGLLRRRRVIAFPRTLYLAAHLSRLLPVAMTDRFLMWHHLRRQTW